MYKLDMNDACKYKGQTLYRLVAIADGLLYKKGDKGGYASGDATIIDSFISESSKIVGKAIIRDSIVIGDCFVHSRTWKAVIQSIIKSSLIEDSGVVKSSLFESQIRGSYISHTSVDSTLLKNALISDSLVENCQLYGVDAYKAYFIKQRLWGIL